MNVYLDILPKQYFACFFLQNFDEKKFIAALATLGCIESEFLGSFYFILLSFCTNEYLYVVTKLYIYITNDLKTFKSNILPLNIDF